MTNTYYAMAHKRLTTFHLFAGAGGGILADILLGHAPVGACEIEPFPRSVLLKRQDEGLLPEFPIWDDVQTMDGRPWRGTVDVLCGGFPCQDISAANPRGKGIEGSRSGLWKEYARLVEEMQPRFVFAENSPLLRSKGLGTVLQDLASMGYNARWGVIGARHVPNGPHRRDRMWVLAYRNNGHFPTQEEIQSGRDATVSGSATQSLADSNLLRWNQGNQTVEGGLSEWSSSSGLQSQPLAYPSEQRSQGGQCPSGNDSQGRQVKNGQPPQRSSLWWAIDPANEPAQPELQQEDHPTEPLLGRVADGLAHRVDRLKAIGNGQVPQCAALAWKTLSIGLV